MKKIISGVFALMLAATALAQDTIPKMQNNNSTKSDTLMEKWQGDPMAVNYSKWDTTYAGKKKWYIDSLKRGWPANDSLWAENRWVTDSASNQISFPWQASSMKSRRIDSTGKWNSNADSMANIAIKDSLFRNEKKQLETTTNTTTADTVAVPLSDRVVMKSDTMYILQNGEYTLLEKNYKLSSGALVMPDGSVKYPSGKTVKLKNGQSIVITKKEEVTTEKTNKIPKKTSKTTKKTVKKT